MVVCSLDDCTEVFILMVVKMFVGGGPVFVVDWLMAITNHPRLNLLSVEDHLSTKLNPSEIPTKPYIYCSHQNYYIELAFSLHCQLHEDEVHMETVWLFKSYLTYNRN